MSAATSADDMRVTFLGDEAQPAMRTAEQLATFCAQARAALDIAIYDFVLSDALERVVRGALAAALARGVGVRLVYESGRFDPRKGPPPAGSTGEAVAFLGERARSVHTYSALMHHKYVVRDAGTSGAAVWTGSTNWTDDAWHRQENVILEIPSARLAEYFAANFAGLWEHGHVVNTVPSDGGAAQLAYAGQAVPSRVLFAPGEGRALAHTAAQLIAGATRRVRLASPVATNGAVLGALADAITHDKLDIAGVYDATQMAQVQRQWAEEARTEWKAVVWQAVVRHGGLAGKESTPYGPNRVHDYMHAKILVADDTVLTGSYSLSNNGRDNAENVLLLESAALADLCAGYIEAVTARYGARGERG